MCVDVSPIALFNVICESFTLTIQWADFQGGGGGWALPSPPPPTPL